MKTNSVVKFGLIGSACLVAGMAFAAPHDHHHGEWRGHHDHVVIHVHGGGAHWRHHDQWDRDRWERRAIIRDVVIYGGGRSNCKARVQGAGWFYGRAYNGACNVRLNGRIVPRYYHWHYI